MRMFWTMFFIGSMLLVGVDVAQRRGPATIEAPLSIAADPTGMPTPRP